MNDDIEQRFKRSEEALDVVRDQLTLQARLAALGRDSHASGLITLEARVVALETAASAVSFSIQEQLPVDLSSIVENRLNRLQASIEALEQQRREPMTPTFIESRIEQDRQTEFFEERLKKMTEAFRAQMENQSEELRSKMKKCLEEMKTQMKYTEDAMVSSTAPHKPIDQVSSVDSDQLDRRDLAIATSPAQENVEAKKVEQGGPAVAISPPHESVATMKREVSDVGAEYAFSESLWDASLFIGIGLFGIGGSFQIFVLLLANVAVQLIYALLIAEEFTQSTFDQDTIDAFTKFRIYTAHALDNMDMISFDSLASRVCTMDPSLEMAGAQVSALESVNKYLPEGEAASLKLFKEAQGQVMCMLSIIVWCLVVTKEVKGITTQFLCVLKLVLDKGFVLRSRFTLEEGVWKLDCFSWQRLMYSVCLSAFRLFIAMFLLNQGLQYLVHTIDLRDLVLNAVALECVLVLDELMFEALAPLKASSAIASVMPLPMPQLCALKGLDFVVVFLLIAMLLTLSVPVPQLISTESAQLAKARDALCAGKKDFIYSSVNYPPYLTWGPSNDGSVPEMKFTEGTIASIIDDHETPELNNLRLGSPVGTSWSVSTCASLTTAQGVYRVNELCSDIIGPARPAGIPDSFAEQYAASAEQYYSMDITTCDDIAEWCDMDTVLGKVARGVCAKTCGCHRPDTKLIISGPVGGCPEHCQDMSEYQEILASMSCRDMTRQELTADDGWHYHANQVVRIAKGAFYGDFPIEMTEKMRDHMLELGCDAVEVLKNMGINMCSEHPDRAWPFRSIRMFCPVSCGCYSSWTNCPKTCPNEP